MRITEIISSEKPILSFEVFPPKTWDNFENVSSAVRTIAGLAPAYMSVTYGAGGGTSEFSVALASEIKYRYAVPTLSHLTCVSSDRKKIESELAKLSSNGMENILALRGDLPDGLTPSDLPFRYASELITEIKKHGNFCVGGACYPEGHPESASAREDIENLKKKIDAGCEFLTTQMFLDNDIFYNFMFRLRDAGIKVPVIPGIMPVTTVSSIARISKMSGSLLPKRFIRIVDRFGGNPKALEQAGIAYATEQIIDLYANGVNAVHLYTMNKPSVAAGIKANLSDILG
ncbi:MAG: methylenetetrahydrofolate reductase [NAD(P)H] [Clostridia bacterium]|nr:methylenetetrahydrofolate reductase [NAD(P)H] [Clostridia bacterium]